MAMNQPSPEPDPSDCHADTAHREKILFVCARNKIRSLTAEKMFSGSHLYDVKSRGVGRDARIRLARFKNFNTAASSGKNPREELEPLLPFHSDSLGINEPSRYASMIAGWM